MSREIKFRGWNVKTKTMLDLKAITPLAMDSKLECEGLFLPFADEVILMQYTGLKDKNGVEIYEDDLVQFKGHVGNFYEDGRRQTLLGRVFYKTSGSIDYCLKVGDQNYGLNSNDVDEYEIIGNIHQNPELLEAAK